MHDEDTLRVSGIKKIIKESNLNELRTLDIGSWKGRQWQNEHIPLLEEVLKTIPEQKKIFIEIKGGVACLEAVREILNSSSIKPAQTTIMDFNPDVVVEAKKSFPGTEILWLYEFIPPLHKSNATVILGEIIEKAWNTGMDGINIEMNPFINKELIHKTHKRGLKFYTWTVNESAEAKYLAACAADGITTDRPGFLKKILP
jgi:glycerophosphoryl diester phosphodiesterase